MITQHSTVFPTALYTTTINESLAFHGSGKKIQRKRERESEKDFWKKFDLFSKKKMPIFLYKYDTKSF